MSNSKAEEKLRPENGDESVASTKIVARVLQTILLLMTSMLVGMSFSIRFTTMPEFRTRLNATVTGLSYADSFGSIGGLLGIPLFVVSDRIGVYSSLILFCSVTWSAFWSFMKIFAFNLWTYASCLFLEEIGWTVESPAVISSIVSLWGKGSSGPMHAIHLGWPLGTFIGPLLASPFLAKNITESTNTSRSNFESSEDNSRIEILYGIYLIVAVSMAVWYIPVQIFWSSKKPGNRKEILYLEGSFISIKMGQW